MAENQKTKSKKDAFMERMKTRYPDADFSNEEDFFGMISDDYDNYDNSLASYKQREKELSDMFMADPRSAMFLTSWRKGEDPLVLLVRQFGMEFKDAIDDPQRIEAIAEANKDFVKRVAKERELEESYKKNLAESLAMIEEMQQKDGIEADKVDAAVQMLADIASNMIVGKITPEAVKLAMNAMSHDEDVAQAAYEGEVKGKNAKVKEQLRKPSTDGMPSGLGGSSMDGLPKPKPDNGVLDRFGDEYSTIWDRGKEKRIRRR